MNPITNPTANDSVPATALPASHAVPVKSPDVVARHIAGETIIVPIKSTAGELDDIFTLNEVASRVWDIVDGKATIDQIAAVIASEYDVTPTRSLEDTQKLVASFQGAGVVRLADAGRRDS